MDSVLTLKQNYNKALERWNKATAYLENPIRTPEEIDKWLPEYESILKHRQELCREIEECSRVRPTLEEFENGFEGGVRD